MALAAYTTGRTFEPTTFCMSTTAIPTASRGRHAIRKKPRGTGPERAGWIWGGTAVLAALAYAPLLAVRPGVVTPDTKTYLYLDPVRFLSQVPFMWNPTVALGTVTHEYIGYLLPMGPFFVVLHLLGVPVWVAQRLWMGSILFAAGAGILYLSRVMGLRGPGPVAAATAYMLSPYFLQYAARISVILLPWAGLPFMLALHDRRAAPGWLARAGALRHRRRAGERHQRELHHLRRRGAHPVAPLRRGRPARVDVAPCPGDRRCALRVLTLGGVPVVDGRPRDRGGLRRQRPQVHRDRLVDVADLQPVRDPAGPGLLVLLRLRPPGRLDARCRPLHPADRSCWSRPTPCPSWPSSPPRSSAGGSAPSSSSSSSSAWCSPSGRSPTATPRGSAAPSRTS